MSTKSKRSNNSAISPNPKKHKINESFVKVHVNGDIEQKTVEPVDEEVQSESESEEIRQEEMGIIEELDDQPKKQNVDVKRYNLTDSETFKVFSNVENLKQKEEIILNLEQIGNKDESPLMDDEFDADEITLKDDDVTYLKNLEALWSPHDISDPASHLLTIRRNLRLRPFYDQEPYSGKDLILQIALERQKWARIFLMVKQRFIWHGLMYGERASEFEARFIRIADNISRMFNYLENHTALMYNCSTSWMDFELCIQPPIGKETNFYKAVNHILNSLMNLGLRRRGKYFLQEVYTREGERTNYWKIYKPIKEFIASCFNTPNETEKWKTMISSPGTIPALIRHFEEGWINNPKCPLVKPNRHLISFSDGIYHQTSDTFYPYGSDNPFIRDIHSDENMVFGYVTSRKYISSPFDDQRENIVVKNSGRPVLINPLFSVDAAGKTVKGTEPTPLLNPLKNIKYRTNTDPTGDLGHWDDTPCFSSIFRNQGITSPEELGWLYAFTGRMFYWTGELDKWEVGFLNLGYAGTGKSTWLKTIRLCFDMEDVGIISNNIEKQWALSSLVNKMIVLGYEVKEDFKWEQAEWQSCIAGEEVSVATKFETAYAKMFLAPIFLAGNEMIRKWKDNSGSLARRLIVFYFRHFIQKEKLDPQLSRKIESELPLIIQKCNRMYLEKVRRFGDKDIWSSYTETDEFGNEVKKLILPQIFHDWNREAMEDNHPLIGFLSQSRNIIHITGHDNIEEPTYCTWDEFNKNWRNYCTRENIFKKPLTKDYYSGIFAKYRLRVEEWGPNPYLDGQVGKWIFGLCFPENPDSVIRLA